MSTTPTATPSLPRQPSLVRRFTRTLRGLILWEHERGTWQYDVMVVLILLFVFLTPTHWFRDQPLPLVVPENQIVVVAKFPHMTRYRIRASLLWQYGSEPEAAARVLLAQRHSKPFSITSITPVEDDAGAIVWYDVWLRDRTD